MENYRLLLAGNILCNRSIGNIFLSCQENRTPPRAAISTIQAIVPSPHLLTHHHCTGAIHSAPIIYAKQFISVLKYAVLICGRPFIMRAQFIAPLPSLPPSSLPPSCIVHRVGCGGISRRYIGAYPCNKLITNQLVTLVKYVIIKYIIESLLLTHGLHP